MWPAQPPAASPRQPPWRPCKEQSRTWAADLVASYTLENNCSPSVYTTHTNAHTQHTIAYTQPPLHTAAAQSKLTQNFYSTVLDTCTDPAHPDTHIHTLLQMINSIKQIFTEHLLHIECHSCPEAELGRHKSLQPPTPTLHFCSKHTHLGSQLPCPLPGTLHWFSPSFLCVEGSEPRSDGLAIRTSNSSKLHLRFLLGPGLVSLPGCSHSSPALGCWLVSLLPLGQTAF